MTLTDMHKRKITAENNILTSAWPTGSVQGLSGRGSFTVDIDWNDGQVTHCRIASKRPQPVTVRVNGEVKEVNSERP